MSNAAVSILITGAGGNLGRKLALAAGAKDWCRKIVAVDKNPLPPDFFGNDGKVDFVQADLADADDRRWQDAVAKVDAVVHFAARTPYPAASWTDAQASIAMTVNLLDRAAAGNVKRFVFASSNHVMGGYKEEMDGLTPGTLGTGPEPRPGTRMVQPDGRYAAPYAYATSKLAGEQLCAAKAAGSNGKLTTVCIRIGWCQPGKNLPETITAAGTPQFSGGIGDSEAERDLRWFRSMWLSNRDFIHLLECAVRADAALWPGPAIVVNGMSDNAGMPWDIEPARALLGYGPQDDLFKQRGPRLQ